MTFVGLVLQPRAEFGFEDGENLPGKERRRSYIVFSDFILRCIDSSWRKTTVDSWMATLNAWAPNKFRICQGKPKVHVYFAPRVGWLARDTDIYLSPDKAEYFQLLQLVENVWKGMSEDWEEPEQCIGPLLAWLSDEVSEF
ncbi:MULTISPECIES: hypothetical protein [unclassified Neorhizobium]|uniref:hypothetical protein n=1 Tax=unclassified Neorhizobium TaxID=2629175 RepID=UPI001FF1CFCF|nr:MULTISPECIES: hypothetical protein [unclassified Neorhizobium]MCJ9672231.1 hypothetical protein [Neorhizobium sp. SHOUNA12B]MCJ9748060.1 hypothetical protein [Neorhizobium sp. SHOUNA12A]